MLQREEITGAGFCPPSKIDSNILDISGVAKAVGEGVGASVTCFREMKSGLEMNNMDFELDLTLAGLSCHSLLSPFTGIGSSR